MGLNIGLSIFLYENPQIESSVLLVISYEKAFTLKLSGNEVYYTACSLLVISKKSSSKLHCQKGFNFILFSYKIPKWDLAPAGRDQVYPYRGTSLTRKRTFLGPYSRPMRKATWWT